MARRSTSHAEGKQHRPKQCRRGRSLADRDRVLRDRVRCVRSGRQERQHRGQNQPEQCKRRGTGKPAAGELRIAAQRIVDWRAEHGPFKTVEELDAVDRGRTQNAGNAAPAGDGLRSDGNQAQRSRRWHRYVEAAVSPAFSEPAAGGPPRRSGLHPSPSNGGPRGFGSRGFRSGCSVPGRAAGPLGQRSCRESGNRCGHG